MITGTDTGVGKTFVAAGLVSALRSSGLFVGAFKPVQSGFSDNDAFSDAALLAKATGKTQLAHDICPYRFLMPVAPLLASEKEKRPIDVRDVYDRFEQIQKRFELVVVEGAGGLLAPLGPDWTILDMAARYEMSALVVVANRLGCLNHALLTERVLLSQGINVLGFVVNNLGAGADESLVTNVSMLRRLTGAKVWGPVEKLPDAHPGVEDMQRAISKIIKPDEILRLLEERK